MLVVSSDVHRLHHSLELAGSEMIKSWDGPDRADLIAEALTEAGHSFAEPTALDRRLLESVHTKEYLAFLETAWARWTEQPDSGPAAIGFTWPVRGMNPTAPDTLMGQLGYYSFAADCSIVSGTWDAALSAAAIAQTATDLVADSDASTPAFGLCRPPGHHAGADQFGGYCYLNNAAISAQRLLGRGASRVAILDVDYHHGNGTQSIFYERSDVLFTSIHADPKVEFPYFAGHADETGTGPGEGWNLNLPLPHGSAFARWSAALDVALETIADAGVDAIVVSLGVDTYKEDPISKFLLDTADYPVIAARIAGLGLPTVILQEGGYAVEAIGTNVAAFLSGFGSPGSSNPLA